MTEEVQPSAEAFRLPRIILPWFGNVSLQTRWDRSTLIPILKERGLAIHKEGSDARLFIMGGAAPVLERHTVDWWRLTVKRRLLVAEETRVGGVVYFQLYPVVI